MDEKFLKKMMRIALGLGEESNETDYTFPILTSPDDEMSYGPLPDSPVISEDAKQQKALADKGYGAFTSTGFTDQRTIRPKTGFGDGKYSPHYTGNLVWGGKRGTHATPSKDNVREPEDDYLNQLMMAALMAGGKKGKMGQLGGAAGGGISFGDAWTMNAPWEKDYRYLS